MASAEREHIMGSGLWSPQG